MNAESESSINYKQSYDRLVFIRVVFVSFSMGMGDSLESSGVTTVE